jgi:hypothetical protein
VGIVGRFCEEIAFRGHWLGHIICQRVGWLEHSEAIANAAPRAGESGCWPLARRPCASILPEETSLPVGFAPVHWAAGSDGETNSHTAIEARCHL